MVSTNTSICKTLNKNFKTFVENWYKKVDNYEKEQVCHVISQNNSLLEIKTQILLFKRNFRLRKLEDTSEILTELNVWTMQILQNCFSTTLYNY